MINKIPLSELAETISTASLVGADCTNMYLYVNQRPRVQNIVMEFIPPEGVDDYGGFGLKLDPLILGTGVDGHCDVPIATNETRLEPTFQLGFQTAIDIPDVNFTSGIVAQTSFTDGCWIRPVVQFRVDDAIGDNQHSTTKDSARLPEICVADFMQVVSDFNQCLVDCAGTAINLAVSAAEAFSGLPVTTQMQIATNENNADIFGLTTEYRENIEVLYPYLPQPTMLDGTSGVYRLGDAKAIYDCVSYLIGWARHGLNRRRLTGKFDVAATTEALAHVTALRQNVTEGRGRSASSDIYQFVPSDNGLGLRVNYYTTGLPTFRYPDQYLGAYGFSFDIF